MTEELSGSFKKAIKDRGVCQLRRKAGGARGEEGIKVWQDVHVWVGKTTKP